MKVSDTSRIVKHAADLGYLAGTSPRGRKKLLQQAPSGVVNALSDCCSLILDGSVKLNAREKELLQKHKNKIRELATKTSMAEKRAILQKGGFVGAIAGALIPAIISGIGGLIAAKRNK